MDLPCDCILLNVNPKTCISRFYTEKRLWSILTSLDKRLSPFIFLWFLVPQSIKNWVEVIYNTWFGGLNCIFIDIWPTETDSRIRGQKRLLKCEKSPKEPLKNIMSKKRAFTTLWLLFTPLNYSEICSAMFNYNIGKFNQEIFLILLDKIMARSFQDLRIFLLSRSW